MKLYGEPCRRGHPFEIGCSARIRWDWLRPRRGNSCRYWRTQRSSPPPVSPLTAIIYRAGRLRNANRKAVKCSVTSGSALPRALDQVLTGFVNPDAEACRIRIESAERNAGYYDGVIFSRLLENLEYVFGQRTHSAWTVNRSRRDLRGRARGRRWNSHDRIRLDRRVKQALWERVSPLQE